jgi:peptide deformylase
MILPIVAYGSQVLRAKTEEIEASYPDLKELLEDMYETMEASNGIGLAAPQVGKAIRLFLVDATAIEDVEPSGFRQTFINPIIEEEWETPWEFEEGCLSIPNIRENVKRNANIRITYQDENFKTHTKEFDGMIARIIQHEYDHIEGILFTDRIHPLKRQFLKKRLENISKGRVQVAYKMKFPKRR